MDRYDDMLRMPRPVSRRHPQMPNAQRAKQFMPFAALRGYGDALAEKEIAFVPRSLLSEEDAALLDQTLRELAAALRRGERPAVELEVFEPRDGGEDGRLRAFEGRLEGISPELGLLRVAGRAFQLEDITAIWREGEA